MRRHQGRGSEDFQGLFSASEGVSLRIGSVGVSRSATPRTGVRLEKLGSKLPSFSRAFRLRSESSGVRSRVRCLLPLVFHLPLKVIHVPFALFAVMETRQVLPEQAIPPGSL